MHRVVVFVEMTLPKDKCLLLVTLLLGNVQAQVLQHKQSVGELACIEGDARCKQGSSAAASHQEQEDHQP